MRYETVSSELIRALRGERSQTAFSRHLGFRCNVLYTWESGKRWPSASTFMRAALRAKVDVRRGLQRFAGTDSAWVNGDLTSPETLSAFLEELRGGTSVAELARRMGVHRVSVSRWLRAQAEPRLPELLRLVEAASSRLLDFIAIFVEPINLPECRSAWQELEAQRQVAYGLPWSHAVLRVLELEAYAALPEHTDAWVAQRLGLSEELTATCLRALAHSKSIVKRRRRWSVSRVLTVDTRLNPDAGTALKRHWADVGRERLVHLEPRKNDLFSYNLFTVSEADWQRIRERHIAYFQELRAIVADSEPADRVVLLNLQLMRLDEPLQT